MLMSICKLLSIDPRGIFSPPRPRCLHCSPPLRLLRHADLLIKPWRISVLASQQFSRKGMIKLTTCWLFFRRTGLVQDVHSKSSTCSANHCKHKSCCPLMWAFPIQSAWISVYFFLEGLRPYARSY